jgi:hypothetical protein
MNMRAGDLRFQLQYAVPPSDHIPPPVALCFQIQNRNTTAIATKIAAETAPAQSAKQATFKPLLDLPAFARR